MGTLEPWLTAAWGRSSYRPTSTRCWCCRRAGVARRGAGDPRLPQRHRREPGRRRRRAGRRRAAAGARQRIGPRPEPPRGPLRVAQRGGEEGRRQRRRRRRARRHEGQARARHARGERLYPARALHRGLRARRLSGRLRAPGGVLVTVVDRSTLRVVADVPEVDFALVAPGPRCASRSPRPWTARRGRLPARPCGRSLDAYPYTRRSTFRTRAGTSPWAPRPRSASTSARPWRRPRSPPPGPRSGHKATIFFLEGETARALTVSVAGEIGGSLFVDPSLAAGMLVVTEGRALLTEGDRVSATPVADVRGLSIRFRMHRAFRSRRGSRRGCPPGHAARLLAQIDDHVAGRAPASPRPGRRRRPWTTGRAAYRARRRW